MSSSLLVCPSFFSAGRDGISRVGVLFFDALCEMDDRSPRVYAANDSPEQCPPERGVGFGRNYPRMLWHALRPSFLKGTGPQRGGTSVRRVICTHLGLSPVARLLARRQQRPWIVYLHGVEAWRSLHGRSRWGLRGATQLWSASEETRRRFLLTNPWADPRRVHTVPPGVPRAESEPLEECVNREPPSRRLRILSVGRMSRLDTWRPYRGATDLYKGFADIVTATDLLKLRGIEVEINFVGDGDARDDLARYVANFPGRASIHFHGSLDDVRLAQQYRDAHVFVLPSQGEGFGLVYAEAMAAGLPCIAAQAGGAGEVVLDGESGLLVPFGDAAALSDYLECLARNPTLYRRLSAGARARHEALFSHPATLCRWTKKLRSLSVSRSDESEQSSR